MAKKLKEENLKSTKKTNKTIKKADDKKTEKVVKSKKNSNKATNAKVVPSNKVSKASKNTSSTKSSVKKNSVKKTIKKEKNVVEYYDLPYKYNQTIVKILAQTPNMLFIYWDISDKDRKNFIKKYGDNFFNVTKPVLIIHNITKNYSFEADINDFANSWYLHITDAFCDYSIELGRRPVSVEVKDDYVFVASSNVIEVPNNHILFDKQQQMVYFKNTKTNIVSAKDITSLYFLRNMGKIYNIYDLYKELYKDEVILTNPSSGNPTSTNPTSTFK